MYPELRSPPDSNPIGDCRPRRRILYLAHRLPYPPDKGDRIRSYHFLSYLAARHEVYLAAFADDTVCPEHLAVLRTICRAVRVVPWRKSTAARRAFASLLRGEPFTVGAFASPEMHRLLEHWSSALRFDAAVAFSSAMAPYALTVPATRHVLDFCDADSEKWREWSEHCSRPLRRLWQAEARRLADDERRWARLADCTTFITPRERAVLTGLDSALCCEVVRNGVSLPPVAPPPAETCEPIVGFVGAMDYAPNVDGIRTFVREVWPLIRTRCPTAELHVIGRDPVSSIRKLHGRDGILVTGTVDDVGEHIRRLRVGIAPLRIARGIPNKALELMAHGRPLVATPAVAACLELRPARDFFMGESATEFAGAVTLLLTDDAACASLADAGRAAVARNYDWETPLRQFEAVVLATGTDDGAKLDRLSAHTRRTIETAGRFSRSATADIEHAATFRV